MYCTVTVVVCIYLGGQSSLSEDLQRVWGRHYVWRNGNGHQPTAGNENSAILFRKFFVIELMYVVGCLKVFVPIIFLCGPFNTVCIEFLFPVNFYMAHCCIFAGATEWVGAIEAPCQRRPVWCPGLRGTCGQHDPLCRGRLHARRGGFHRRQCGLSYWLGLQ